ncbi:hypothetical protein [Cellulosimicrobium sp. NPDC057862]|uniref:hypothetical protein n=1 Tax=Actinomycetes TaxID=1760 RepID=UPI003672DC56
MSAPTSTLAAAARARRQATVVAAVGAIIPTILAAQGMASLAVDVLRFPLVLAVALAGFLELALVASALLARAAALAGRPGGADAVAVWVVSATSGLLAGVHELTTTAPDGSTSWSADPGSVLAAAVRVVAPLVAAWLWDRVLTAARAEQAERTLAEVRRDRRYLAVARRALVVRRMAESGHGDSRRARAAARRMDRAHVAALRAAPPHAELVDVLAAVGQVDHLPAATIVRPLATEPDTNPAAPTPLVEAAPSLGDAEADHEAGPEAPEVEVADRTAEAEPEPDDVFSGARVAEDFHEEWPVADRTPVPARLVVAAPDPRPATVTEHVAEVVPGSADDMDPLFPVEDQDDDDEAGEPDTLAVAIEVVRADPLVSGARLADELTRRGLPVSTRSGQRWRARALAAMAEVPVS